MYAFLYLLCYQLASDDDFKPQDYRPRTAMTTVKAKIQQKDLGGKCHNSVTLIRLYIYASSHKVLPLNSCLLFEPSVIKRLNDMAIKPQMFVLA